MRSNTLLLAAITCATLALGFARPAAAADARAELASRYGIALMDAETPNAWRSDEATQLLRLMQGMPLDLRNLAAQSRFGHIRVFKSHDARSLGTPHSAPALLFWQMQVNLAPSPNTTAPTTAADAAKLLNHRFIHQLLHVYDAIQGVSAKRPWRSLSGWRPRSYFGVELPFLPREADNQDPRGFAAEAGMRNAEEDFVTFGEAYFADAVTPGEQGLACRMPDKFAFFERQFPDFLPRISWQGSTSKAKQRDFGCLGPGTGFLEDIEFLDPITRRAIDMGPIDAAHVDGFEILYATPGVGDAAEIAGHLILRVRLHNNQQAERLGVANPHDLVISFLADTDAGLPPKQEAAVSATSQRKECGTSTWLDRNLRGGSQAADFDALRSITQSLKGLSGGFLTTFDRQTLEQTVRSYTADQDRNLLRYELRLTRAQKEALIARLYLAKKNYKSKYYFFDRNCASILVQLIGEGIGDDEVADFDPFVVPPNALVAMLVRKGLATPVQPAFYSYRKKGYVAQEEIKDRLAALEQRAPNIKWPTAATMLATDDDTRVAAYVKLKAIAVAQPAYIGPIYAIASLGQEAELAFADHALHCDDYTSLASAEARSLQTQIIATAPDAPKKYGVDVDRLVYERYAPGEAIDSTTGSAHTNLSSLDFGLGGLRTGSGSLAIISPALSVNMALHRQDMGSISSQAMQRATFVALGDFGALIDSTPASGAQLAAAHMTGLSLRKFKERLDDVPPWVSGTGGFGLGLTVLDTTYARSDGAIRSTLGRGELLANIASSRLYNRFLYVSFGLGLSETWWPDTNGRRAFDKSEAELIFPLRVEGLWTFDAIRAWQLRGSTELRFAATAGKLSREVLVTADITHRLAEPLGTEVLVRGGASMSQLPGPDASPGETTMHIQFGLEWNRW